MANLSRARSAQLDRYISEIVVEQLFGRYNYRLILGNSDLGQEPRMSLLYGDNGTGKTTILNLLFHLLSCDLTSGHKTRVANIPFQEFSVTFSDNTKLTATRTSKNLTGNFNIQLSHSGQVSDSIAIVLDPDTGSVTQRVLSPAFEAFISRISNEVPDVFFLGDTRTLESDAISTEDSRTYRSRGVPHFDEEDWHLMSQDFTAQRGIALKESIRRVRLQLYIELAQASTQGEVNARQIYADILRSISSASDRVDDISEENSRLRKELADLETISAEYAAFDLGSAIDAAPLLESLTSADESTLPIVVQVLRSFQTGQRARLNALSSLYTKMSNIVSTTNNYFTDKSIRLALSKGLTIEIPSGELEPESLSSGEQHLLLLFLNVLSPKTRPRLYLIDEPELSLNVKWQRQIVDSLTSLTEGTQCQFLLATHSIELLARHREYVVTLKP